MKEGLQNFFNRYVDNLEKAKKKLKMPHEDLKHKSPLGRAAQANYDMDLSLPPPS
jgi:hypothetical protein